MSNIFDGYTEDGKKPEIPKIPPLRKESLPSSLGNKQKAKDSLSKLSSSFGLSPASIDLRAAAKEPAKSDSSDDDSQVKFRLKLKNLHLFFFKYCPTGHKLV